MAEPITAIDDLIARVAGGALLIVAIVLAMAAAVALRVFLQLARRGPQAAWDAYEKGASLSKWWRGGDV